MGADPKKVAAQIMRYLRVHPEAQDTLEGVKEWWIAHSDAYGSTNAVRDALELLIKKGPVVTKTDQGGSRVYSKGNATD